LARADEHGPVAPGASLASVGCGVQPSNGSDEAAPDRQPEGAGERPDPLGFWQGSSDPEFGLSGIDPWRVQLVWGTNLHSRIWLAR
jgi:hypothetical protein